MAFADVATLAASRRFELRSAFRPTYNMAANLVRRHDPDTAHRLLALSFAQFQSDRALVRAERGIDGRRQELADVEEAAACDRGDVAEYLALVDAGEVRRERPPQRVIEERLSELSPGDVVDAPMKDGHERVAVLSVAHRAQGHVRVRAINRSGRVLTFGSQTVTAPPVPLGRLDLPEPYRPNNQKFRNEVARRLDRTKTRRPSPSTRERIDPDEHPVAGCPDVRKHLRSARRARRLRQEIGVHEKRLGQDSASLARQFDRVLQVLQGRGILDGWSLTESGLRLARIYHESDLLVAEALDEGLLDGLDGPGLVALLSCFTYEHRSPDPAPAPTFPNVLLRQRWERWPTWPPGSSRRRRPSPCASPVSPTRGSSPWPTNGPRAISSTRSSVTTSSPAATSCARSASSSTCCARSPRSPPTRPPVTPPARPSAGWTGGWWPPPRG